MASVDEVALKTKILERDFTKLEEDFEQLRADNREARKGIYTRLTEMEKITARLPSPEQQELINQATSYYKAKKDFWESLLSELAKKGILAACLFAGAACLYYAKHLLEK